MTADYENTARYRAVQDFLGVTRWMADDLERDKDTDLTGTLERLSRMLGSLTKLNDRYRTIKALEEEGLCDEG